MGRARADDSVVMDTPKTVRSVSVDRIETWSYVRSDASLFAEAAREDPSLVTDYYELNWYLYRLDEIQRAATSEGKHPAAVAAIRTMAELIGLLGPQLSVDARTQVLQLPEGMSEAALIALATGSYAAPEIGVLE